MVPFPATWLQSSAVPAHLDTLSCLKLRGSSSADGINTYTAIEPPKPEFSIFAARREYEKGSGSSSWPCQDWLGVCCSEQPSRNLDRCSTRFFSLVTMMWLDQRLRQDYRLRQREETIIGQLQQEANDKRNQDRTSMTSYVLESAIAFQQWKLWQVLVSFDPGAMDSWQILRLSISCSLHSAGHGSCWTAYLMLLSAVLCLCLSCFST